MTWRSTSLVVASSAAALVCSALPAAAVAHSPERAADPTPAYAQAALAEAVDALAPDPGADPDREATVALTDLVEALPSLSGFERRRALALLARPTDREAAPFGNGYADGAEVRSAQSSEGHFCVTWVTSTRDAPPLADHSGSGVPDYVEQIAAIAETSRRVQVDQLGWRAPLPDHREECGVPGQTDIYLKELGRSGTFGYQATDPDQGQARRRHGYLVLDNDYGPTRFPGFREPLDAARVTLAHELNHLLQIATSARQDRWMFEATATWMEEKVFPWIDDYLRYLPAFARTPGVPITAIEGAGGMKPYGSAVINHWLEARHGPDAVRRAWEASAATRPADLAVRAYGRAIVAAGGTSFASELVPFAAASAEWRAAPRIFPDAHRHPDVRRQGGLAPGGGARSFSLDHTGYRLLRVAPGGARRFRLRLSAPEGLRSGLALVGRRGGPVHGEIVRRVRYMPRGGAGTVVLRRPGRFDRITAVAVNADARVRGRRHGDWLYTRDRQPFRARLMVNR